MGAEKFAAGRWREFSVPVFLPQGLGFVPGPSLPIDPACRGGLPPDQEKARRLPAPVFLLCRGRCFAARSSAAIRCCFFVLFRFFGHPALVGDRTNLLTGRFGIERLRLAALGNFSVHNISVESGWVGSRNKPWAEKNEKERWGGAHHRVAARTAAGAGLGRFPRLCAVVVHFKFGVAAAAGKKETWRRGRGCSRPRCGRHGPRRSVERC